MREEEKDDQERASENSRVIREREAEGREASELEKFRVRSRVRRATDSEMYCRCL